MHRSPKAAASHSLGWGVDSLRVLITGAAGSGTTTLATALARHWRVPHLEVDAFLWLPTQPPYTHQRALSERKALLVQELEAHSHCVVAGSVAGWGVEALLDAVVFLYVEPSVRLQRLQAREVARFGAADPAFLAWAAQYDDGPPQGRSLAMHEAWLASLCCPVIRLGGEMPVQEQIAHVTSAVTPPFGMQGP